MAKKGKIRVLVAKPGLDGHNRGAIVIANALRDAGMEVIYTGLRQSVDMVVEAAAQEYVDVVGLSMLSGAHLDLVPAIIDGLKEKGMSPLVLVGGIMPEKDISVLHEMGVKGVFGPGTLTKEIVEFVNKELAA
ncbi:cobalamin B12-binding domain-containing protein [Chloroflexota bacterium]